MTDAVAGPSPDHILQQASSTGADLQQLANRFNAMMAREPDPSIYTEQHLQQSGSPVSAFVQTQETMMRQTFDEVHAFMLEAPHLDAQALASRQMQLQYQVAMTALQFQTGASIAQSAKSGLQTLMKNQ